MPEQKTRKLDVNRRTTRMEPRKHPPATNSDNGKTSRPFQI